MSRQGNMINRALLDRVFNMLTVLAVPVLLFGLWNAASVVRAKTSLWVDQRRHRALADSVVRNYAGRAIIGNTSASVSIMEFLDYECPACKEADPVLRDALEASPDMKVIVLQYPLSEIHRNATLAARAAICAEHAGVFRQYHHALFATSEPLTEKTLLDLASESGVIDRVGFRRCLDSSWSRDVVESHRRLGERLGVGATPTFVDAQAKKIGLAFVAGLAKEGHAEH